MLLYDLILELLSFLCLPFFLLMQHYCIHVNSSCSAIEFWHCTILPTVFHTDFHHTLCDFLCKQLHCDDSYSVCVASIRSTDRLIAVGNSTGLALEHSPFQPGNTIDPVRTTKNNTVHGWCWVCQETETFLAAIKFIGPWLLGCLLTIASRNSAQRSKVSLGGMLYHAHRKLYKII